MIRPFSANDLSRFSNIFILSHAKKDGILKDYLLFRRSDFISCLVIIDDRISLLVKQFRPIVNMFTVEIPMGKLEKDEGPLDALKRELREECCLSLDNLTLTLKKRNNHLDTIRFKSYLITDLGFIHPSPGFSDIKNFRFMLNISTENNNIEELLAESQLLSEESDLEVFARPIHDFEAWQDVNGISKLALYEYLISISTK
ncbi:MAG: NUDIX hydrolase [Brevinema sp.]